MYAIVDIAGKQFRVQEKQIIKVPLLHTEDGKKVEFDNVLFFNDGGKKVEFGAPFVKGVKVAATVLEHGKDKKVIVFKKKRRKGYQVKNGHRQQYTMIQIDKIGAVKKAAAPKAEKKEAPATKTTKKADVAEKEVKKTKVAPKTENKKTAAPKKTAEKKEA